MIADRPTHDVRNDVRSDTSHRDLSRTLAHTTAWRRFLLHDPLPAGLPEILPAYLKSVGQAFLSEVHETPHGARAAALDRWYASREGQQALAAFATLLWDEMAALSEHAMPAHDARHAMFKVPAASLEYMHAEPVDGWQRLGLLGALLHDWGRWAEERVWGHPGASLIHARLSFVLGRELLARFDMPQDAKDQILLAALRHTSGALPDDPMPLKLTVTADREQLYGAELVLRQFHHVTGADGNRSTFYGEKPGATILDHCEKFLRNRLPGPLFCRDDHQDVLWWDSATFLLRCETADASRARFTANGPMARAGFAWESAWEHAQQVCPTEDDPERAARRLLAASNVAPALRFKEEAVAKTRTAPDHCKPLLAAALAYADAARSREDARQRAQLERIRTLHADDALVQVLVRNLLAGW